MSACDTIGGLGVVVRTLPPTSFSRKRESRGGPAPGSGQGQALDPAPGVTRTGRRTETPASLSLLLASCERLCHNPGAYARRAVIVASAIPGVGRP